MLERVFVIIVVVVVIVRIEEKHILFSENKGRAHVRAWQADRFRIADGEDILVVKLQVAAHFIAQVGGRVLVADHF